VQADRRADGALSGVWACAGSVFVISLTPSLPRSRLLIRSSGPAGHGPPSASAALRHGGITKPRSACVTAMTSSITLLSTSSMSREELNVCDRRLGTARQSTEGYAGSVLVMSFSSCPTERERVHHIPGATIHLEHELLKPRTGLRQTVGPEAVRQPALLSEPSLQVGMERVAHREFQL
jgi:hypothetical protein